MRGKLLAYFILVLIIISSSLVAAQCNKKAYSCSEWNECDQGIRDRDCSVVFYCENKFNANPAFDLSTPISPIHEELACDTIMHSDLVQKQILYADINSGKINTIINISNQISFYHDSVYTDIYPVEIGDNYILIQINDLNYFVLNSDQVTLDINQDNIDDTIIRYRAVNSTINSTSPIIELELEFIKSDKPLPEIAHDLKEIQEVQQLANNLNQTESENKIDANSVDKNVFIAIFVVLLLLIFNKFLRIREEELAESLLGDFEKRRKVYISDDPDYFKQKDHELHVKLIKRKNYYGQVDTLLNNFKKQLNKLKTMKNNSDKIVERNIKKNDGVELKLEVAKTLPKVKTDDLSKFIEVLEKAHKQVTKTHKSKQVIGRKVREVLNNELKTAYKNALKKLKGHNNINQIKKLQKSFENKKISSEKFKKELKAIMKSNK